MPPDPGFEARSWYCLNLVNKLYSIHQELNGLLPGGVEIVPVLGSAANTALVEHCFREQGGSCVSCGGLQACAVGRS